MGTTLPFDEVAHGAINAFTVVYCLCLVLVIALYFNRRGWRWCSSPIRFVRSKEGHMEDIMYLSNSLPERQAICLQADAVYDLEWSMVLVIQLLAGSRSVQIFPR